ncbi:hypothetical protein M5689_024897 [Euphorbia peplus]|nr:hypothetical protein M5689_024897 [Euphorbia peplus]
MPQEFQHMRDSSLTTEGAKSGVSSSPPHHQSLRCEVHTPLHRSYLSSLGRTRKITAMSNMVGATLNIHASAINLIQVYSHLIPSPIEKRKDPDSERQQKELFLQSQH